MMKKTYHFVWSDAANTVFEDLKKQLAEPPVLAAPVDKEPLLLYVAANARAVSVAIVVERKETARNIRFNGRFTMSVRYSLNLRRDTHIGRSWFVECSRPVAS